VVDGVRLWRERDDVREQEQRGGEHGAERRGRRHRRSEDRKERCAEHR
jgi:hypothetical protein